jgi:hypothetical protein
MRLARVIALILGLAVFGCGAAKPKVVPVRGKVTLDGTPLSDAKVYFKTPQTGAIDSFDVKDGQFSGAAEEGERRVEIHAYRTRTLDVGYAKHEVKENFLPAKYNADSTLTAKVVPDGANEFMFEVTKK